MSAPVANPPAGRSSKSAGTRNEPDATSQPQPVPQMGGVSGFNGNRRVPPPVNEPVKTYAPGSPERAALKTRLRQMAGERIEIPVVIGGREIRTGEKGTAVMPHDHRHVLADWHKAGREHVEQA